MRKFPYTADAFSRKPLSNYSDTHPVVMDHHRLSGPHFFCGLLWTLVKNIPINSGSSNKNTSCFVVVKMSMHRLNVYKNRMNLKLDSFWTGKSIFDLPEYTMVTGCSQWYVMYSCCCICLSHTVASALSFLIVFAFPLVSFRAKMFTNLCNLSFQNYSWREKSCRKNLSLLRPRWVTFLRQGRLTLSQGATILRTS